MTDDLATLRLLLEQAERQRDDALAEQMKLEASRRAADAQSEQIAGYRRDYEARWRDEFSREGRIELIRCYQGFMEKLHAAVEQQQSIAARAAAQVERAEAIVRGHELRAAGLKKLVERRLRESEIAAARLAQKENDDRAVRRAWSRLTAPGGQNGL
jgi:flagellar protein FliJ